MTSDFSLRRKQGAMPARSSLARAAPMAMHAWLARLSVPAVTGPS